MVCDLKQKTKLTDLCKDMPVEFIKYLEYTKKLHFKFNPDYRYLKGLFYRLGTSMGINYEEYEFEWNEKAETTNKKMYSNSNLMLDLNNQ